jgi:hypothetical protein
MTLSTLLDKVVEALRNAGATEEIIAAAVKAGGEFGGFPTEPRRPAEEALCSRAHQARRKDRSLRDRASAEGRELD